MNIVDSSAWLEYFADGENASFFADAIEDTAELIVPVICLYEVFKRVLQQRGESAALTAIADMSHGQIVEVSSPIALSAAYLSAELRLPMADSLILATARVEKAVLWTQDEHFKELEGVRFIEKH
jgi:predicted nucleic acid-binding protein